MINENTKGMQIQVLCNNGSAEVVYVAIEIEQILNSTPAELCDIIGEQVGDSVQAMYPDAYGARRWAIIGNTDKFEILYYPDGNNVNLSLLEMEQYRMLHCFYDLHGYDSFEELAEDWELDELEA